MSIPKDAFIVGSGYQETEIRQYAEDSFFWITYILQGEYPMRYVELFDVVCLLNRWEGFRLGWFYLSI